MGLLQGAEAPIRRRCSRGEAERVCSSESTPVKDLLYLILNPALTTGPDPLEVEIPRPKPAAVENQSGTQAASLNRHPK